MTSFGAFRGIQNESCQVSSSQGAPRVFRAQGKQNVAPPQALERRRDMEQDFMLSRVFVAWCSRSYQPEVGMRFCTTSSGFVRSEKL